MKNNKSESEQHDELEVRFGDQKIATIRLQEGRIVWDIDEESARISGFSSTQLHQFVSRLINAPLKRNKQRHKAMPDVFGEITPNSEEHYHELVRACGPFSIVPLPMP